MQICYATFQYTLLKILRGEGKNTREGLASGIDAIQCIYVAASFKEMFMLPIETHLYLIRQNKIHEQVPVLLNEGLFLL